MTTASQIRRTILAALLAIGLGAVPAPAAAVEISWLLDNCEGGKLCPWWQVKLAPPQGWRVDEEFGKAHKTTALALMDNAKDDPVIYVASSLDRAKDTVDARVARSEEQWRKRFPDAKIERLEDVPRASGEAPFRIYRYRNPSHAKQSLEYLAWAEHTDAKGNRFFFLAGLTNGGEQVIERAKAAFYEVLKNL